MSVKVLTSPVGSNAVTNSADGAACSCDKEPMERSDNGFATGHLSSGIRFI